MFKKRIPTILGLILLILGAFSGVLFINSDTGFLPRAAPEYIPQKINITNVSDSGFVVSWITQEPTIGFVKLGTKANSLDTLIVDERDQLTGDSGNYRTHYISVLGLSPSTQYYFKLGSQGKRLYDDNGQALTVTTGPSLSQAPSSNTLHGTVLTPADTPAEGAIIYLSLSDDQSYTPQSALVKQNGKWAISLSGLRTADLTNYAQFEFTPQQMIQLMARSSLTDTATAVISAPNAQPVPPIILGQNHDFTSAPAATDVAGVDPTPIPESTIESRFSLLPIVVTEPEEDKTVTIDTFPKNDLSVNSNQPLIQGKAPPGTPLTISVHSDVVYTEAVNSDETGRWSWTPPGHLTPGPHQVTIAYADDQGILHSVTRSFVVSAATANTNDVSPRYTATPSATLKPSPSTIPTTTPTLSPTLRPTVIVPTSTPAATPSAKPTALPQAGESLPTLAMLIAGVISLFSGFILLRRYQSSGL